MKHLFHYFNANRIILIIINKNIRLYQYDFLLIICISINNNL